MCFKAAGIEAAASPSNSCCKRGHPSYECSERNEREAAASMPAAFKSKKAAKEWFNRRPREFWAQLSEMRNTTTLCRQAYNQKAKHRNS